MQTASKTMNMSIIDFKWQCLCRQVANPNIAKVIFKRHQGKKIRSTTKFRVGVAKLVQHWTGMPLRQVWFLGVARDFSSKVYFQCRLSYSVYQAPHPNLMQSHALTRHGNWKWCLGSTEPKWPGSMGRLGPSGVQGQCPTGGSRGAKPPGRKRIWVFLETSLLPLSAQTLWKLFFFWFLP